MNGNELEFSKKQLDRIDEIHDAVYRLCQILTEKYDGSEAKSLDWDMSYIGEIADTACDILVAHGYRVRYPAMITETDGFQWITNWHGDEVSKLMDLLRKNEVPFDIRNVSDGVQIVIPGREAWDFETDERRISVVSFTGTYGFERGLLEIYAPGLNSGVEGFLDAEKAYEYIADTRNGISRGSTG